jgi:hypothetical protein
LCSLFKFFFFYFSYKFHSFSFSKIKILRLKFHSFTIDVFKKLLLELSPAAPAAALTAPEQPSLPPVGTTVAAERIAAPPLWLLLWRPDPRPS